MMHLLTLDESALSKKSKVKAEKVLDVKGMYRGAEPSMAGWHVAL
jgi:hypothetical protein